MNRKRTAISALGALALVGAAGAFLYRSGEHGDHGSGHGDHGSGHGDHGDMPPAPPMVHPEPWSGSLDPPTLEDANPDPNVVEVSLVARPGELAVLPGRTSSAWTYNGRVPGPTLRAKRGDRVVVHYRCGG
jgi:manganese oxidase